MRQLPERFESKFRYVLVTANRAEQLMRGARPKMELVKAKPTRLAMEEIQRGLVEWSRREPPPPEPEAEVAEEQSADEEPVEVH